MKNRKTRMRCKICRHFMVEKKWRVDFLVDRRFISVVNFPLLVCPYCGEQQVRSKDNLRVLNKLNEKQNHKVPVRAIKFEEVD